MILRTCHYIIRTSLHHNIIIYSDALSSKVQHLGHRIYIIKSRYNEIFKDVVTIDMNFSIKNF